MSVTIAINGELILDQTAGLQDDDVDVGVTPVAGLDNDILTGALDSDFLSYLNTLPGTLVTDTQKSYAALVEGASQAGLVTVNATANETVGKLFFADASGNDFDGDQVLISPGVPLQTIVGQNIYLWSAQNGKVVLATTSSVSATSGSLVAAFYIESENAANTSAKVESITFIPLAHPNTNDPDDRVDFSDILRVAAVITTPVGDDIGVDDDGPTIVLSGTEPTLTVDETTLATNDAKDFSTAFTPAFGTDGAGSTGGVSYALNAVAGASGLTDSATGQAVILSKNGSGEIEGRVQGSNELVFKVSVSSTGNVTLDQSRAVIHTPDSGPDQSTSLSADNLVTLTATITDADGDHDAVTLNIGQNLNFEDDAPTAPGVTVTSTVKEDESAGIQTTATAADPNAATEVALATVPAALQTQFAGLGGTVLNVAKSPAALVTLSGGSFGNDGAASSNSVAYALSVTNGTASGLSTSGADTQIFLYNGTGALAGLILGRVGVENAAGDTADPAGAIAFALAVGSDGSGYIAELRAIKHGTSGSTPAAFDDFTSITNGAVKIAVTYTDKDGDQATSTPTDVGSAFEFQDDGPSITAAASPGGTALTALQVNNAGAATASGTFGYDVGADQLSAYGAGRSDFVDANGALAGVQLSLSGSVTGPPSSAISNTNVTLSSESASTAVFNFSFDYDKDPLVNGVQTGTASGTLTFNKLADTYTVSVSSPVQGFSFNVLHTSELLAKQPTGNTGHPPIVVERLAVDDANTTLDEDFYVQFTADSTPFGFTTTGQGGSADKAFTGSAHDLAGGTQTWVSATQSTNGVAGDTIQKDELLTLRFFKSDILGDVASNTEKTDPTATASGIVLKFDGIGNSEDLIMILDLKDKSDGSEITRAVVVENADIYKLSNGGVPAPYNTEFTLDNNDGLVVIESNDYNAANEDYEIQGVQILQSGNGLTGSGINLIRAVGQNGGSSTTTGLQAFENTDNDVLKIVDIGFVQSGSGTQDAHLDFSFVIRDADNDVTATQHLFVDWVSA